MIKVFLVEDEIVMREGIKNTISWEKEGFQFVGEASDGELAYPLIQKTRPDILITDIKMPFMDGLELSRLVKKELPAVKIIILSGYDDFKYAQEGINIGIADYLLKPVTGARLLAAIKKVAEEVIKEKEQKSFLETYDQEQEERQQMEKQKYFRRLISGQMSVSAMLSEGAVLGWIWRRKNTIFCCSRCLREKTRRSTARRPTGLQKRSGRWPPARSRRCLSR